MTIKLGSTTITALRLGSTEITQVRLGSTLIWAKTNVRDDFNRDDQVGLGPNWADHGTATNEFRAGISQNTARAQVPDALFDIVQPVRFSRWRYSAATVPSDNGYVEFRIGNAGAITADHITQVYGRLSNGGWTHGVGVQLDSGLLRIVRMVGGTETIMASSAAGAGNYASGDIIRLTFNGQVFSLYRNGTLVAGWTDTGSSAVGAGYRSLGIRVTGSKDFFGPRRYSASIDYVEAG